MTPEEEIAEIRRLREIEEIKRLRSAQAGPQLSQGHDTPRVETAVAPIGSSIPILGAAVGSLGEYAGAGLRTLTHGGTFDENLQKFKRFNSQSDLDFSERNPGSTVASTVAGGVMLPGPKNVFKVAEGAGKLARAGSFLGNIGASAAQNAAVAAADAELRGLDAEEAATNTATISATFSGAAPLVRGASKYIPRFVFGVKPETASKYRARAPQINAASEEELITDIEAAQGRLKGDVETARSAADAARAEKAAAERMMQAEMQNLRPPSELPGEIGDTLNQLGRETSEGSSAAFDVLQKSNKQIPIGPAKGYLTERTNRMKIGNALPDTPESRVLLKYRDFLDETGLKSLRPEQMKQFVQMLDEDVADAYAKLKVPGERLNAGDKALIAYRRFVDGTIKEIPEYAEAMKPVASKARLLSEARDIFSDEKRTHRLLKNLHAPENANDRQTLEALGRQYNKDFIGQLSKYEKAQQALKNPAEMARLKSGLPESQAFGKAEEELADRQLWLDPVKGMGSAQSAVRRVASDGRPDFKSKERLRYLGDVEGKDFLQTADDLGVQRALNQGFTRGSRNTNLGAFSVGGLLGKLFKGDAAMSQAGQGIGAMMGAAADLVGPQTYKAMLDFSMRPQFSRYQKALSEAARRGPNAYIATMNHISQQDPGVQEYLLGLSTEEP